MKRFSAVGVAAVTAISLSVAPAVAADGSSQVYSACVAALDTIDTSVDLAGASNKEKEAYDQLKKLALASEGITPGSSNEGTCINGLLQNDEYKGGLIAMFTLIPLAIVAIIGLGAAAAGLIPGVTLPF